MDATTLFLEFLGERQLAVTLRRGPEILQSKTLTLGQDFDILLINTLDKFLSRNRIGKLSLKSVEISGKSRPKAEALSGMILEAVARALEC